MARVSQTTSGFSVKSLLHVPLGAVSVIILAPIAWMVVGSFKSQEAFFTSLFFPPGDGVFGVDWSELGLGSYVRLFIEHGLGRALANSLFLASTFSACATLLCAASGYALAMYRFRGQSIVFFSVIAALIVPAPLLIVPVYSQLHAMGLLDTYLGLLLPGLVPAFGVFLFRQAALRSVPKELIEAGRIDGCGEIQMFFVLALPLLRPMVGAFVMITFLGMWNNFIGPQVVLQSPGKYPLAVAVAQLRGVYYQDYGVQLAATVVSVTPVAILFLLLQREFLSGLTAGAVKG